MSSITFYLLRVPKTKSLRVDWLKTLDPWFWMRQQGPQDTGRPSNLFSQGLGTSAIRFNFFHTAQIMHETHALLRLHGLKDISSADRKSVV